MKFVTDGSLGRLARWLRALGVDAEHVPAGAAGRHDALLALAARDDRVILTRDRRLMARREAAGAYLVDELLDPKRQLAVVSSHFGLRFRRGRLLTRCAKCNGEVETRLTPEEVATHPNIPEKGETKHERVLVVRTVSKSVLGRAQVAQGGQIHPVGHHQRVGGERRRPRGGGSAGDRSGSVGRESMAAGRRGRRRRRVARDESLIRRGETVKGAEFLPSESVWRVV